MNFHELDDKKLWKLLASGNSKAFEFIYRSHAKKLYSYGHRFTKDSDLIDDVIQDVFIRIWESKSRISISKSISFYLFTTFRHLIIKKINENHPTESLEDHKSQLNFQHYMETFLEESRIAKHPNSRTFTELEKLPSRQKEAIYLRFVEELPYENISEIMGGQIPYIYNLIFKGLKTLKEKMVSTRFIKILIVFIFNFS
ncbi:hypothetical protein GCM10028791_02420 [Echinicola sediminis]